ncbi:hypothetical protein PLICRDRAFT_351091 [Plicaturopsis crispa FD-325 SS-3]|uniref:F-box domain-containing protein n=1 Tax=Plicaturopsis crispa FD-325 SS-3 TaxID=944288 RepID=A0A0C9SRB1_PLICR|nr:hypothetical protein PLICRDRAFT_351091 [Plicaturopsis crispa FD-325 SS-3]
MQPRLPPELTDAIINCLRGDVGTLLACAYVSRDWVAASRCALFSSLEPLTSTFPFKDPRLLDQRSIDNFVRLLDSPLCTLHSTVRYLYLDEPFEGSTVVVDQFPDLTSLLSVQRLSIKSANLGLLSPRAWDVLTSHFAGTVRELQLDNVLFRSSVRQIFDLIQAFSSLEILALVDTMWRIKLTTTRVTLAALHTIHISGDITSEAVNWITSLSAPRLRTITLTATHLGPFLTLLAGFPPSLIRHLVFMGLDPSILENLDLPHYNNLRVLDIGNFTLDLIKSVPFRRSGNGHFIPTILARVTSSHMEEVRFGIIPGTHEPTRAGRAEFIWDTIGVPDVADTVDTVLAQPRYARLKSVVVRVPDAAPEGIEYIKQRLPNFRARGILVLDPLEEMRREGTPDYTIGLATDTLS